MSNINKKELIGITKNKIDYIKKQPEIDWIYLKYYEGVLDLITRLEQIDNAKTSEALERISSEIIDDYPTGNILVGMTWEEHSAIKQALLKAQELESENNALLEENNDLYAELTLANKQYKELIESTKQYQKVLEIIKEKCVSIWHLMRSKTLEDYISYLYIEDIEDTKIFILTQEEFNLLKRYFEKPKIKRR